MRDGDIIIVRMEVFLGYLLGLGTVVAIARRGDTAKTAVAWTARQVGAFSGKVASSLEQAASVARAEYARGREEQLVQPLAEGLELPAEKANGQPRSARGASHLNGN